MATNNSNLKQFNVQHYAGPISKLPIELPFGDFYFAEDVGVLYKYNYQGLPISLSGVGGGTSYRRAESYSSLTNGVSVGDLAFINSSEGTVWLPGNVGGSYYPSGWYLWNGTLWVSDNNAIANQFETNISSLNTKVDKIEGSSLIADEAITRLSNTSGTNTGDQDLSVKVDVVVGERLINANEIIKLGNLTGINTGDEVQATDTIAGIAEIATQAEVNSGSDDSRIVTPSKLKSKLGINGLSVNYNELIYTAGLLTKKETYVDNSRTDKLFTKNFTYTSNKLTQVTLLNIETNVTVTKTLNYDANGNLINITKI